MYYRLGFIFGLFFLLLSQPSFAGKIEDLQKKLEDTKESHAALTKKATELNSELTRLKNTLVKTSTDLRESEENLSDTERKLRVLRKKKNLYIESLYKDQHAMGGLVSAARKYAQTPTSSMLAQEKPIDAARASLIMKSMIPSLHQQSNFLKSQLAELDTIEQEIADQLTVEKEQTNKLNAQQDSLALLVEERKKLYQATESERQAQEKEMAQLTREAKNLEDLMEKIKEKKEAENKRKNRTTSKQPLPSNMLLPVHGTVAIGFGEKDELGANSRGITFTAKAAAPVITPLGGTVKFAGPFQNYKQILIIEHQGGYHSLIAGLGRIDTVVGASLDAGEPIGIAEKSSIAKIYYELRENGRPINPQKLKAADKKAKKDVNQ